MLKFADALLAFARALYDLLSVSNSDGWFAADQIAQQSGLDMGSAMVSRILTLSEEEGEYFSSEGSDGDQVWTLGKEGFDLIEAAVSIEGQENDRVAPAADRVVQFNHNAPEALEISNTIAEICESVRGANGPEIDEQERLRVFNALQVAKAIWDSGQFKIIQLKVGVILAVEDAAMLLSKTAKHVAAALLVDAIKGFIKSHFHVDLDAA